MLKTLTLNFKKIIKTGSIPFKVTIIIIIMVLVGGVFSAGNYILELREYKKSIADIAITDVNLYNISDGTYVGSYDAKLVAAEVQVDVYDHTIKDVYIVYHKNKRGKNAESIVEEIKSAQSLEVDSITGATNSSKVILKAIQNALRSSASR